MNDPEAGLAELRERLRNLPQDRAAAAEAVRRLESQSATGRSSDGRISVCANGHGAITSIELSDDTMRRLDSHTLGQRLTEAVNQSLEAADSLQAERSSGGRLKGMLDEAMDMFNHRVEGILSRLDEIGDSL